MGSAHEELKAKGKAGANGKGGVGFSAPSNATQLDERVTDDLPPYDYDKLVQEIVYDQQKKMNPWDPAGFQEFLESRDLQEFQRNTFLAQYAPPPTKFEDLGEVGDFLTFRSQDPLIEEENTDISRLPGGVLSDYEENEFFGSMDPRLKDLLNLPTPTPHPPTTMISDKTKDAVYRLNNIDPVKYHSHRLAAMFGLSLARVQAILRLKFLASDLMSREKDKKLIADNLKRASEEQFEATSDRTPLAQWDPDYYTIQKNAEAFVVDDRDAILLKKVENARQARFWSVKDHKIRREQAQAAKGRAFGAPPLPLPSPQKLSENTVHPMRYHLVMTDISGQKKNKYRIAVRDKDGHLREPDDAEFRRVRFREKSARSYFHYIPFKVGDNVNGLQDCPLQARQSSRQ
mmetsp:Transcript_40004/g.78646  ORF Transcript_40004/g.78646 Transcript_40004/m.78646 type:complete len:402 (+) Transcript_40004:213-1418(+)